MAQRLWIFEDVAGHARITRRWTLQGEEAVSYTRDVAPGLRNGITEGMNERITASTLGDLSPENIPVSSGFTRSGMTINRLARMYWQARKLL
jgi:hypothetical protein